MPDIMCFCNRCGRSFSSGIAISGNAAVTLQGNISQCPYCGSMEKVPDGTFRSSVDGIIKHISRNSNPLNTVKSVLADLERAKESNDLSIIHSSEALEPFKKWLPNTPEKLAAYIAIFYTIYLLLTQQQVSHVEYNQIFIQEFNQQIDKHPELREFYILPSEPQQEKPKWTGPCPCGSGKKYKNCCWGRAV